MNVPYPDSWTELPRIRMSQFQLHNSTPLVITDLMVSWPSFQTWDFNFFKNRFRSNVVGADRVEDGITSYVAPTFEEYVDYVLSTKDKNPYYAKTGLHLVTELSGQYSIPPEFSCWYKESKKSSQEQQPIHLSCIYIGPANAKSPLHIDIWCTSFWNALFKGRKLWVFIREEEVDCIYSGHVDPFNPDFEKYPLFRHATPLVHIQEPGELIYCPGGIWHAVLVIEPSIALSENFINEENYQKVLNYFREHGLQKAYRKLSKIVSGKISL